MYAWSASLVSGSSATVCSPFHGWAPKLPAAVQRAVAVDPSRDWVLVDVFLRQVLGDGSANGEIGQNVARYVDVALNIAVRPAVVAFAVERLSERRAAAGSASQQAVVSAGRGVRSKRHTCFSAVQVRSPTVPLEGEFAGLARLGHQATILVGAASTRLVHAGVSGRGSVVGMFQTEWREGRGNAGWSVTCCGLCEDGSSPLTGVRFGRAGKP